MVDGPRDRVAVVVDRRGAGQHCRGGGRAHLGEVAGDDRSRCAGTCGDVVHATVGAAVLHVRVPEVGRVRDPPDVVVLVVIGVAEDEVGTRIGEQRLDVVLERGHRGSGRHRDELATIGRRADRSDVAVERCVGARCGVHRPRDDGCRRIGGAVAVGELVPVGDREAVDALQLRLRYAQVRPRAEGDDSDRVLGVTPVGEVGESGGVAAARRAGIVDGGDVLVEAGAKRVDTGARARRRRAHEQVVVVVAVGDAGGRGGRIDALALGDRLTLVDVAARGAVVQHLEALHHVVRGVRAATDDDVGVLVPAGVRRFAGRRDVDEAQQRATRNERADDGLGLHERVVPLFERMD